MELGRGTGRWTQVSLGLLLLLGIGGCCSPECEPENLPHGGVVETPKELFELAQYAALNDCCDVLYSHLSQATQDEHSELKFCLFWESLEVPEPFNFRLVDVVGGGKYVGVFPFEDDRIPFDQELVYVEYQPPGGKNLLAQILLVYQLNEAGQREPRLALQEQTTLGPYFDAGR
jgi:hypothetical protein